jgi:hypothetical protein
LHLRQMSGCCKIALAKQCQHLCGSNLRYPIDEMILTRGLIGLI